MNSLGFRGEVKIGFLQFLFYPATPKGAHTFFYGVWIPVGILNLFLEPRSSLQYLQLLVFISILMYVPIDLSCRNQLKGVSPPHRALFIAAQAFWLCLLPASITATLAHSLLRGMILTLSSTIRSFLTWSNHQWTLPQYSLATRPPKPNDSLVSLQYPIPPLPILHTSRNHTSLIGSINSPEKMWSLISILLERQNTGLTSQIASLHSRYYQEPPFSSSLLLRL